MREVSARKGSLACITALSLSIQANAQEMYSFKDDGQLNGAMLKLAERTADKVSPRKPCKLHIVTVAGGGELFTKDAFKKMNLALAKGVDRSGRCEVRTYELDRDRADALIKAMKLRGTTVLMLEVTYIPLTNNVVAFAKLRNGTGRLIGESARYDLPVTKAASKVQPVASITAAPATTASTPEKTQLLTEVHFDPGSAAITYVGNQKIGQAIEAIKKQKPKQIRILGFSDSIGSEAANKAIATARAANVARLLKQNGINLPVVVEGKGEKGGPYNIPDNLSEPLNRCVGIIAVGGE